MAFGIGEIKRYFFVYTFAIGLLPIIFIFLVNHHVRKSTLLPEIVEDENRADHEAVNSQVLILTGDNKGDSFQITLSEILFIKSADNYCEIAIMKDNNVSHKLLRSSLISILKQLPEKSLVHRCHRSYAVNLASVELSTGNAGGLKLVMKPIGITVPVSRTYVDSIKQALLLIPEAC